jgi:indole-3-glycerol phosphate synthase
MSDILNKILATKVNELAIAKAKLSLDEVKKLAENQPKPRDFVGSIRAKIAAGSAAVIAEIKRYNSCRF